MRRCLNCRARRGRMRCSELQTVKANTSIVSVRICRLSCVISAAVYRFLGMTLTSLVAIQSIIHHGPNLLGQITMENAHGIVLLSRIPIGGIVDSRKRHLLPHY